MARLQRKLELVEPDAGTGPATYALRVRSIEYVYDHRQTEEVYKHRNDHLMN